jgi:hypothetical protein
MRRGNEGKFISHTRNIIAWYPATAAKAAKGDVATSEAQYENRAPAMP